jgi:hypothetical protein
LEKGVLFSYKKRGDCLFQLNCGFTFLTCRIFRISAVSLPGGQVFTGKQLLNFADSAACDRNLVAAAEKQEIGFGTGHHVVWIYGVGFMDPKEVGPQSFLHVFQGFGNEVPFALTCIYVSVVSFSLQVCDLGGSEPKYAAGNVDGNMTCVFAAGEGYDPGIQKGWFHD